ncbi:MAG: hypothetical protein WC516_07785 [Patescibacteria group bacterium]|jgi:hypothetical protein
MTKTSFVLMFGNLICIAGLGFLIGIDYDELGMNWWMFIGILANIFAVVYAVRR